MATDGTPDLIRFKCPTCAGELSALPSLAGEKFACPHCAQRLQVPAPPRPIPMNKTVLGTLEGHYSANSIEPAPAVRPPPVRVADSAPPVNYEYERRTRYHTIPRDDRSNALASLSLACGIGSLLLCPPFLGPLAILLGVISLCLPKEQDARPSAIGGIVCGIIGTVVSGLLIIFALQQPGGRF
jgi:hypothetical protein